MTKKAGCAILCAALLFFCLQPVSAAPAPDFSTLADEITAVFDARKAHSGGEGALLTSESFLKQTETGAAAQSSSFTDWIALAMGRFSLVGADGKSTFLYDDGQTAYLAGLETYVSQTYAKNGGMLSKSKVTETQRCALTVEALGGNPRNCGVFEGTPVDLIADGTYNSKLSITRQGVMGIIFALISKNACGAKIPQTAEYSDTFFYTYLLERELPAGGWALTGSIPDVDVTAMALCALAFAESDPTFYTVTRTADNETVATTVDAAAARGLAVLSRMQRPDGGYASGGVPNCESCAQVLTALSAFGIDAQSDPRFSKNGKTVLDALRSFRLADGSFAHMKNENGKAETYNVMATDQAAYALVAFWRSANGLCSLYDMRPDFPAPLRTLLIAAMRYVFGALSFLSTGT